MYEDEDEDPNAIPEVYEDTEEIIEIKRKIDDWFTKHNNTFEYSIEETGLRGLVAYKQFNEGARECGTLPDSFFIYYSSEYITYTSIRFTAPITPHFTFEEIKAKFAYLSVDKVPTNCFNVDKWKLNLVQPNSYENSITFHSFANGRISYTIDCNFQGVGGQTLESMKDDECGSRVERGTCFYYPRPFRCIIHV